MSKVSVGFFTPGAIIKDIGEFCRRVVGIVGPSSSAFPLAVEQTKPPEGGRSRLTYAVVTGAVPLHIDKPNANESTSSLFQFVMATQNRPFLLTAAATAETSSVILDPDCKRGFGIGALELRGGLAVHFDIARVWHGITGAPTGEKTWDNPAAVILQVPLDDPTRIETAVQRMIENLRLDERVADLVL